MSLTAAQITQTYEILGVPQDGVQHWFQWQDASGELMRVKVQVGAISTVSAGWGCSKPGTPLRQNSIGTRRS